MSLDWFSLTNPTYVWTLKTLLLLLGSLFALQFLLTRKTWVSCFWFLVFSLLLLAPSYFSYDPWSGTEQRRAILLVIIFSFFILSPFSNWIEHIQNIIRANAFFKRSSREIQKTLQTLSSQKSASLIAIERLDNLSSFISTGVSVKGEITQEVLASLFASQSPAHDGGVIIAKQQIAACKCSFPASNNPDFASEEDTQLKTGLGLAERTDALVLTTSSTGEITIISRGKIEKDISPKKVGKKIMKELTKTKYQKKITGPLMANKKLSISNKKAISRTSLLFRFNLLAGILFFTSLFISFFPKGNGVFIDFAKESPWIFFPFLENTPWGWIYFFPALSCLFLAGALSNFGSIRILPEKQTVVKIGSWLGIPLMKRSMPFHSFQGVSIAPSKRWKGVYELLLVKSSSKSLVLQEHKNITYLTSQKQRLEAMIQG